MKLVPIRFGQVFYFYVTEELKFSNDFLSLVSTLIVCVFYCFVSILFGSQIQVSCFVRCLFFVCGRNAMVCTFAALALTV